MYSDIICVQYYTDTATCECYLSLSLAEEIVRKINLILEGLPSSRAKSDYDWKEQSRSRKGSKTIV